MYEFGPFQLDSKECTLECERKRLYLTPKSFDLLLVLVENAGHLIEKDELLNKVWPDAIVEEANLSATIYMLRKVLRENADDLEYIETVPKRGYRFVAEVREVTAESAEKTSQDQAPSDLQEQSREPQDVHSHGQRTGQSAVSTVRRTYFWLVVGIMSLSLVALSLFWPFTTTEEAIDSIAVLPFENVSNDPELDYLADGISENIINILSQLRDLKVISRASSFRYRGPETDPRLVGVELGVRTLVMGKLFMQGDELAVSAELMDVEENRQLWGVQYKRGLTSILDMQQDIAKKISEKLGLRATSEEVNQLAKTYTENGEAQEAYLKGLFEVAKFTIRSTQKAIRHFEEAIERDPDYALAYVGLANCYFFLGQPLHAMPYREAMPKAEELAMKALELDNRLSDAHAFLGRLKLQYRWNWTEAEKEFKIALELNPNSSWAHRGYAFFLTWMGRHDEAIAYRRGDIGLDPLNLIPRTNLAESFHKARRYDEGIEQCQAVLEIDPNYQRAYYILSWMYEGKGLYREAATAYQEYLTLGGVSQEEVTGLAEAAASGHEDYWRWRLDYWKERAKTEYVQSWQFAKIYAALGEKDQAFEWLDRAYESRAGALGTLKVHPQFDPLRDDPRFQDLLRRMNLEP